MTKFFILILISLSVAAENLKSLSPAESLPSSVRRLGLFTGINSGGPSREKLRYAVSDAKAMLHIFEELGGVSVDDSRLLVEPSKEILLWEMGRLREKIQRLKAGREKVELIVYYSGHADQNNLLIGNEKLSYSTFQQELADLRSDICITILDSCASGAFIREKGSRRIAPFLFDRSYDMKGYAVMTSSSADEASQESDLIKSSYFTHYLVSGLRGAADTTRDGMITLNEAYQFAFKETLANTASMIHGPQHPNYNIKMSGTGDVVLTDIRSSSVILQLSRELEGTFFIHNARDELVSELRKNNGYPLEYGGLSRGKYRIVQILRGETRETHLEMPAKGRTELADSDFKIIKKRDAVARGDLEISRSGLFSSRSKLQMFAGLSVRMAYSHGEWSLKPGIELGFGNEKFSLGILGVNQIKNAPHHPPYWGLYGEHRLFSVSSLNLSAGILAGMGFMNDSDARVQIVKTNKVPYFLLEPFFVGSLPLSSRLHLKTGVSMSFLTGGKTNALSWTIGLVFSEGRR